MNVVDPTRASLSLISADEGVNEGFEGHEPSCRHTSLLPVLPHVFRWLLAAVQRGHLVVVIGPV